MTDEGGWYLMQSGDAGNKSHSDGWIRANQGVERGLEAGFSIPLQSMRVYETAREWNVCYAV